MSLYVGVGAIVGVVTFGAAALSTPGGIWERLLRSGGLKNLLYRGEGLKVVYEGSAPEVDIVFVHGVNGNPVDTWTSQKFGRDVNWTTDLLPIVRPRTRVLTYGYSSKLFTGLQGGCSTQPLEHRELRYLPQALYLHSHSLIEQLADLRTGDAEKRPIIFIAHSLGGLIVKSALVHASATIGEEQKRLKRIELLTTGILFFGTPQREMPWNKWIDTLKRISAKFSRAVNLSSWDGSIQSLAYQAELLNLQVERYKSIEGNFFNFSFYEGARSMMRDGSHNGVVEKDVAIPEVAKDCTWEQISLDRSHGDLAKFDSSDDTDFVMVLDCIDRCLRDPIVKPTLDRHDKFFEYLETPRTSSTDLASTHEQASHDREDSESGLQRVDSTDSKEANQRALEKSETAIGLSAMTTLEMVRRVASDSLQSLEYDKAEAYYKRLFVSVQYTYAPCSAEAAEALKNVAEVALQQGRLVEATRALCHVRDIQRRIAPEQNDPKILRIIEQIADLYTSRRLFDEALAEIRFLIQLSEAEGERGESSDETIRLKDLEANLWQMKGQTDKYAATIAHHKHAEVAQMKAEKDQTRQPTSDVDSMEKRTKRRRRRKQKGIPRVSTI